MVEQTITTKQTTKQTRPTKRVVLELDEEIAKPTFCENGDDFVIFLFEFANFMRMGAGGEMGFDLFIAGAKVLLREYLACVASGKIRPIKMEKEHPKIVKETQEAFRTMIIDAKQDMVENKIPMKEVAGELRIDYDKLYGEHNDEGRYSMTKD